MGTVALSLMPELRHLKSIWIAPLTTLDPIREGLLAWRGPKIVVAGDADEAFVPVQGVQTVLVPNGDHGLYVGDAAASARALADALDEMRVFIST